MINKPVFEMSSLEYVADFLMVPIYIIIMMHYNDESIGMMTGLIVVGFLTWTFYEYLIHRFLSHHGPKWFIDQHDDHHRLPKQFLGNKPWMTALAASGLWCLIYLSFGIDIASAYTSGTLIGYLIFSAIHVNVHHGDPATFNRVMAYLYRHHVAHHRGGKSNFGVTVDWWDRLFGTHTKV